MPQTSEFYVDISKEILEVLGADIAEYNKSPKPSSTGEHVVEQVSQQPKVTIYTDGSWKHQVQAGAWCALLIWEDQYKLITESEYQTTINRMEISAVIKALEALKVPCDVLIVSDSQLTVNTINYFIKIWKKKNFISSKGKEIANRDLIDKLVALMEIHKVKAKWVKAHTHRKDPDSLANAVCDWFAQKSVDKLKPNYNNQLTEGVGGYGCDKVNIGRKKRTGKKHRKGR